MLQIWKIDTGQGGAREKKAREESMVSDSVLRDEVRFLPPKKLEKKEREATKSQPIATTVRTLYLKIHHTMTHTHGLRKNHHWISSLETTPLLSATTPATTYYIQPQLTATMYN